MPSTAPIGGETVMVQMSETMPKKEQMAATNLTSPMPIASLRKMSVPSQPMARSTSAPTMAEARLHEKHAAPCQPA